MSDAATRGGNLTPRLLRMLRGVMDTIPALINVKDQERRYVFVNRYLCDYYGDRPEDLIGHTADEIMPAEAVGYINETDLHVLERGEPTGIWEVGELDRDGNHRQWVVGKWPLRDPESGDVVNIVTMAFDITELHAARQAGIERQHQIALITAHAPVMLLTTMQRPDGTGTIPFVAGRIADEIGIDRDAVARDAGAIMDVIHPDDRELVAERWRRAIDQVSTYTAEFRVRDLKGAIRWVSATASHRRDEEGSIVSDEVVVDITELHTARLRAEQREQQIASLARNVPGLIARRITKPDGSATIPYMSGEFVSRLGIDPEAAARDASTAWRTIHPDDLKRLARIWQQSQASLEPFDQTMRFIAPNGDIVWYRTRSVHHRQDNGDIVSDTMTIDVTEEKRAELELRRERELLQSVTAHIPGLVFRRIDGPGDHQRYDFIEGAMLGTFGVTPAEARADPQAIWRHFERADLVAVHDVIARSLVDLQPYSYAARCRVPATGEVLWIEVSATPRAMANGAVATDGIAVDITRRVRAEAEAREQRALLQQVIDAVPAAINVKDRLGRIEMANRALADYYGVDPEMMLWTSPVQVDDSPVEEAQTREWDQAVLESGKVSEAREYTYIDPAGRTRYWLGKKSPLRNPDTGVVERVVTVSLDITDRVNAEDRARQRDEMLRSIAVSIPGAILRWRVDPQGRIDQEFAAGQFVQTGQIATPDGHSDLAEIWPALDPDDSRRLARELAAAAARRGAIDAELRTRSGDETRWIKLYGRFRARVDDEAAWDLVALDATESKRHEEQLRIAQKMDAIGNLTGGIAHDFNNVLAIIVANLDLLLDGAPLDDESRQLAQAAVQAAVRGADLTGRLLAFARNQPAAPTSLDCNDRIAGMWQLVGRSLGPEIELDIRPGVNLPRIRVDPGQFDGALMNLVVNARDALDGRGRIIIETGATTLEADDQRPPSLEPGHYVVIAVTDFGSGMTPEIQRRAFEPLFTTKSEGRGTGYGLPMVYSFARQAGGHVTLYSEPGHGTTVRIYLPADRAAADPAAAAHAEPCTAVGRGGRILLVDDNDEARRALATQLRRRDYVVIEANDGSAALALAESEAPIDLLISDIIMPGDLNGAELADRLHAGNPSLPVLLTSGYPTDTLAERRMALGRYELIGKPFRQADLMAAVARLLGQADP